MSYLKPILLAILLIPTWVSAQCPTEKSLLSINIVADNYPDDITWKLFINNLLTKSGKIKGDTICADTAACVRFEIYDSYGDGLCCGSGKGSYAVLFKGDTLFKGGKFAKEVVHETVCKIDTVKIKTALQAMITHANKSKTLSLAEREKHYFDIIWEYSDIFPFIFTDVLKYIAAYEANFPIIFQNRNQVEIAKLAPETRLLIGFQQYILDTQLTPNNIAKMEGVAFKFSSIYPGAVAATAPRIAHDTVSINGNHVHLPAAITAYDLDPAKRPTGYYAAPGEIITITIPANLVGAGLVAQIGVHTDDLSKRNAVNRLVRITSLFPLNKVNTQIISPLGGGIYIKIPEPSKLGWFDVSIKKAIKSPYFSLKTGHETLSADWKKQLANHHVEWVDLESDKYMMTLPWINVKDLNDPTSLMKQWNDIMDAYNFMGGRPPEARSKAEYFAVDCMLPNAGAFGIGYPQIIGEAAAPFGPLGSTDYYPTHILKPQAHKSGLSTTFHELGHAAAHPKLPTERETIVNLYAVYIFNKLYDVPLEEAFKYSEFQSMNLDQAAIDWMVTHNFRANKNMSCDPILPAGICDELQYQHRGHAKYVEMAKHFGWNTMYGMNNFFYKKDVIKPGVWADIFKKSDDMIEAACDAQGVNMSPLFHFWGLAPSSALAKKLEAKYGFDSKLCKMLKYYKTIVPKTGANLQSWYKGLDHQNWIMDDRYKIYTAKYESEHYYDSIQAQIDFLIVKYGPCNTISVTEQANNNISITPNPTDGLVNIYFENEKPYNVQVISVDGRLVFQQKNISNPNFSFTLDGIAGVYIVEIDTGASKVYRKVVKSKH